MNTMFDIKSQTSTVVDFNDQVINVQEIKTVQHIKSTYHKKQQSQNVALRWSEAEIDHPELAEEQKQCMAMIEIKLTQGGSEKL